MAFAPQRSLSVEPSARAYSLDHLCRLVEAGKIRIPSFQRGLRWDVSDAAQLIDSVLRGFPIGSFLFWRHPAPESLVRLGDLEIPAPEMADAYWVVDGQQRLTVLANALSPDAGFEGRFALELDLETLKVSPVKGKANAIGLPTLFDLRRYLTWAQQHPEHEEYLDTLNDAASRLRSFQIPAYIVESAEEDTLIQIFDRMNNSGKRLNRGEVFSALHSSQKNPDAPSLLSLQQFVDNELGWGNVDSSTLLQAFLATRGPDVAREIRTEFSPERLTKPEFDDSETDAYLRTQHALQKSISFLRSIAIPHYAFLPLRSILVTCTRFFAHFPEPNPRNIELLSRWVWRAALSASARGGGASSMRKFAQCIRPGEQSSSVQRLIDSVDSIGTRSNLTGSFRANTADGRVVLCALWAAGPIDPLSQEPITESDLRQALQSWSTATPVTAEIFSGPEIGNSPDASRARLMAGNRIIITTDATNVADQLVSLPDSIRSSHLIPEKWDTLCKDPYKAIAARNVRIDNHVREFLLGWQGSDLDNSPPLGELIFDELLPSADVDDSETATDVDERSD